MRVYVSAWSIPTSNNQVTAEMGDHVIATIADQTLILKSVKSACVKFACFQGKSHVLSWRKHIDIVSNC